jgi:hypothetical protein
MTLGSRSSPTTLHRRKGGVESSTIIVDREQRNVRKWPISTFAATQRYVWS